MNDTEFKNYKTKILCYQYIIKYYVYIELSAMKNGDI